MYNVRNTCGRRFFLLLPLGSDYAAARDVGAARRRARIGCAVDTVAGVLAKRAGSRCAAGAERAKSVARLGGGIHAGARDVGAGVGAEASVGHAGPA